MHDDLADDQTGDLAGDVRGSDHGSLVRSNPAGADPRVDQALEGLAELDDIDVIHHPARYDDIHRALTTALDDAALDDPALDDAALDDVALDDAAVDEPEQ